MKVLERGGAKKTCQSWMVRTGLILCVCVAGLLGGLVAKGSAAQGPWLLPPPWVPGADDSMNLGPKGKQVRNQQVAVAERGAAVAIWEWHDESQAKWLLRSAAKPPGGSFGTDEVLSLPGQSVVQSEIAINSGGTALIVWATSDGQVSAIEKSPDGGSQRWTLTNSGGANPGVAIGDDGSARILWEQRSGADYTLLTVSRSAGEHFSVPPSALSEPYPRRLIDPQVEIGPDGTQLIVWMRSLLPDWDEDHPRSLYSRTFDPVVGLSEVEYMHQVRAHTRPALGVLPNGDAIVVKQIAKNRVTVEERPAGGEFKLGYLVSDVATSGNDDLNRYEQVRLAVGTDGRMAVGWIRFNPNDPEGVETVEVRTRAAGAAPHWDSWDEIESVEFPIEYVGGSFGSLLKPDVDHQFAIRPNGLVTVVYDHFDDAFHLVRSVTREPDGTYNAPVAISPRSILPTTPVVGLDRSGAATAAWINGAQQHPTPDRVVRVASTLRPRKTLTVSSQGSGRVRSEGGEIDCGAICSADLPVDAEIVLEADPAPGFRFVGWTGVCSGTQARCVVDLDKDLTVSARFKEHAAVNVSLMGSGSGRVDSQPAGIACGEDCSAEFPVGEVVTLTATPDSGHLFTGWSGGCQGTSAVCRMTLSQATDVTAEFMPTVRLTQRFEGFGPSRVSSNPGGIDCTSGCFKDFRLGQTVRLTAHENSTSEFSGWSGACTGTDPICDLTLTEPAEVTARFIRRRLPVNVSVEGTGGSVVSDPARPDCGSACSWLYPPDTSVTLRAIMQSGSTFQGWTGSCRNSTGTTCELRTDRSHYVSARFAQSRRLTVQKAGTGSGSVRSNYPAIDCGSLCSSELALGAEVTLRAEPGVGSRFTSWTGACAGENPVCRVSLHESAQVTARFTAYSKLTVKVSGDGGGEVTSNPSGIKCAVGCSMSLPTNSTVRLTASPESGSTFARWTGACSGTNPVCEVTLAGPRQVNAGFTRSTGASIPIRVALNGVGNGRVTSAPGGIDCGTECADTFDVGQTVTLTATPASGSRFLGWSGDCVDQGRQCTLTTDQTRSAVAEFGKASSRSCPANQLAVASTWAGNRNARLLVRAGARGEVLPKRNRLLDIEGARVGESGAAWVSVRPNRAGARLLSRKRTLKAMVRLVFQPVRASCKSSTISRAIIFRPSEDSPPRRQGRR